MNDALHEAARFMQRDLGEILHLQGSKKGVEDFTRKCYMRLSERLMSFLQEKRPKYGITLANQPKPNNEMFFCIEPIAGITNFKRSLPFCGVAIGLFSKQEALAFSIYNPVLREIFYAGKGMGAWFENYNDSNTPKSRMRVSNQGDFFESVISSKFKTDLAQNRYLGAHLLEMAYLAAGRLDIVISEAESLLTQAAFLMVKEAGGYTEEKGEWCLASNGTIIKQASEFFYELTK